MCTVCSIFTANREAQTTGELQTPVHYAAKNDASSALKMLIKMKCEYRMVFDYKGRTPLHVAAELGKISIGPQHDFVVCQ